MTLWQTHETLAININAARLADFRVVFDFVDQQTPENLSKLRDPRKEHQTVKGMLYVKGSAHLRLRWRISIFSLRFVLLRLSSVTCLIQLSRMLDNAPRHQQFSRSTIWPRLLGSLVSHSPSGARNCVAESRPGCTRNHGYWSGDKRYKIISSHLRNTEHMLATLMMKFWNKCIPAYCPTKRSDHRRA